MCLVKAVHAQCLYTHLPLCLVTLCIALGKNTCKSINVTVEARQEVYAFEDKANKFTFPENYWLYILVKNLLICQLVPSL